MFRQKFRENRNTHFIVDNAFFSKILPFMRQIENIVERGRPQMTTCCMINACWMSKATNTHTDNM